MDREEVIVRSLYHLWKVKPKSEFSLLNIYDWKPCHFCLCVLSHVCCGLLVQKSLRSKRIPCPVHRNRHIGSYHSQESLLANNWWKITFFLHISPPLKKTKLWQLTSNLSERLINRKMYIQSTEQFLVKSVHLFRHWRFCAVFKIFTMKWHCKRDIKRSELSNSGLQVYLSHKHLCI